MSINEEKLAKIQPDIQNRVLKKSMIETKLGTMLAIADDIGLYLLEFLGSRGLDREVEMLILKTKADIAQGATDPIKSIALELESYFDGKLRKFKTPIHILGTHFQMQVWEELMHTPYGATRTYKAQAEAIGKPKSYRAVANANGANQLAIVIPCHRIINCNGDLGGYAGGLERKQWLINHEDRYV